MPNIHKLDATLINQIAAGEVVERPASVVKELVENSIDANATKIAILIEGAGKKLIQVIDDGVGMEDEDALMAFEKHATSKIKSVEDLSKIVTMGFRGEALSSIASIARVTLISRQKDQETGVMVHVEGGKMMRNEKSSSPQGTNIIIEDLFFNTPARKKFIKADATEMKHISDTFLDIATSHPKIHFELTHNGKNMYTLPAVESTLDRLHDIFGRDISDNLIPIMYDSPKIKIKGYVGHPSIARTRRVQQRVFLNKRSIQDHLSIKAATEGYNSLIPRDRFPILFIFIELDPQLVDVNVHPRKLEVKYEDSSLVFTAVKQATHTAIFKKVQTEQYEKIGSNSKDSFKPESKLYTEKTNFNDSNSRQIHHRLNESNAAYTFNKELLKSQSEYSSPNITQIFNTYILLEKDERLLIIDQHAAAERVTFEKLKLQHESKHFEKQQVLMPITIELSEEDFSIINSHLDEIKSLGIDLEPFGKNTLKIGALPVLLSQSHIKSLLEEIQDDLKSFDTTGESNSARNHIDHVLATMACHHSIRAGMKLERSEMIDLVTNLMQTENPYSCPHGRSIIWEITKNEIEKKVMRH